MRPMSIHVAFYRIAVVDGQQRREVIPTGRYHRGNTFRLENVTVPAQWVEHKYQWVYDCVVCEGDTKTKIGNTRMLEEGSTADWPADMYGGDWGHRLVGGEAYDDAVNRLRVEIEAVRAKLQAQHNVNVFIDYLSFPSVSGMELKLPDVFNDSRRNIAWSFEPGTLSTWVVGRPDPSDGK